jgi:hypothetical protein
MDEQAVRAEAEIVCAGIVAGDMDRVIDHLSRELHQNIGEVIALLPLPATAAVIDAVDMGGSSYNVALRLTGESEEVVIQTRWKERDGRPTIIEARHLSRSELAGDANLADGSDGGSSESDEGG